MTVADASLIYALLDADDANHDEASSWYKASRDELATTPLIVAEVDHIAPRAGEAAQHAFRRDLASGSYRLAWSPGDIAEIVATAEKYRDLGVSLADASLVWLASRLETNRIATFDERHFRVMRPLGDADAFTLLPADAD